MKLISLDGCWKLYCFPQGKYAVADPEALHNLGLDHIDAVVPGNVELDLMTAGQLPDLFYGNNISLLKPYELYEWWYERQFDTPVGIEGRRVELVMHGVDCIATYWLNGRAIGRSDNMFIEHRFDITGLLNDGGTNTLTVRLASPIVEAMKKDYEPSMMAQPTKWEQLWIRKAPHSYGWDIMPRAVSAGLWRSVELIIHDNCEISDVYFYTRRANQDTADIGIYYELEVDAGLLDDLELRFIGRCQDSAFKIAERVSFAAGALEAEVEHPKLWWPRGYGEANLYEVTVQLVHSGKVIDQRQYTMGIRTVKLMRTDMTSDQRPGQFMFKINDTPILCKGSNWVSADAFHSRDAARYEDILGLFNDLNCNILRCWGGNVYEDHAFYDRCDRYGIMVWQDFAMACACYPQAPEFLETIKQEAMSVVKKLRNHPSIVLWCGDNECDDSFIQRGLDPARNRITREVLPQVIYRYDPDRPYLPSSPYWSDEVVAAGKPQLMPEQHLWGPRDYYKSRYYTEAKAHFVSEIGYHGCPNVSSIKHFIDEEHLWPWWDNDQWITHCTDSIGKDGPYAYRIKLMADQIKEMFGFYPDNLEDFVVASQISQAEAKKFFIEMTRLRKWRRTGVIWWNMIDGWPQFSDAVVDYYFAKKLAYHYIKRVQQLLCIMIDEPDGWYVRVVAGNDSNKPIAGSYRIWDADSDQTLLEGDFSTAANQNAELGRIRVSHGQHRLFLIEWVIDGVRYGNHYLLGHPPFDLEQYKRWLVKIAMLQPSFEADKIGR